MSHFASHLCSEEKSHVRNIGIFMTIEVFHLQDKSIGPRWLNNLLHGFDNFERSPLVVLDRVPAHIGRNFLPFLQYKFLRQVLLRFKRNTRVVFTSGQISGSFSARIINAKTLQSCPPSPLWHTRRFGEPEKGASSFTSDQ